MGVDGPGLKSTAVSQRKGSVGSWFHVGGGMQSLVNNGWLEKIAHVLNCELDRNRFFPRLFGCGKISVRKKARKTLSVIRGARRKAKVQRDLRFLKGKNAANVWKKNVSGQWAF